MAKRTSSASQSRPGKAGKPTGKAAPAKAKSKANTTKASSGSKSTGTVKTKAPLRHVTHEQIAARAYEIWQSQGHPPHREREIWLQAEQELLQPANKKSKAKAKATVGV